jgi:hypothetical protein
MSLFLSLFYIYLFYVCLKYNSYIRLFFLLGVGIVISGLVFFDIYRNDLWLNSIFLFVLSSFRFSSLLFDRGLLPLCNLAAIIYPRKNYIQTDFLLLICVVSSYIVALPDLVRFSSLSYNAFHSGDFYFSPSTDFLLSISGLLFVLFFVYRRFISSTSIVLLGGLLALKPLGFFLSGFRFPFLGTILFTFFAYLSFRRISIFTYLKSLFMALSTLSIKNSSLTNLVSLLLFPFFISSIFIFRTLSRSESGPLDIGSINPFFILFYELASGSAYSLEKLSLSFHHIDNQPLQLSCFIFNESFPPYIPRSFWISLKSFFTDLNPCTSYSAALETINFTVFGANSGTASSLFADFYHYGSFLFFPLIFLFILCAVYVSSSLERILSLGLTTTLSRIIFIASFNLVSPLMIFWRLDIYSVFPLGFITTMLLLALPKFLFTLESK